MSGFYCVLFSQWILSRWSSTFPPILWNINTGICSLDPTILPTIKIIDLFPCMYYCSFIKMGFYHRWPRLLTQQTSITGTVYRLPTKGKQTSVCRKQTEDCRVHCPYTMYWNGSIYLYLYLYYIYIYTSVSNGNWSQGNFPYPFTVCSSCKRKVVVCPFVYEETNRIPFANALNGLAHLCFLHMYSAPRTTVPQTQNSFKHDQSDLILQPLKQNALAVLILF